MPHEFVRVARERQYPRRERQDGERCGGPSLLARQMLQISAEPEKEQNRYGNHSEIGDADTQELARDGCGNRLYCITEAPDGDREQETAQQHHALIASLAAQSRNHESRQHCREQRQKRVGGPLQRQTAHCVIRVPGASVSRGCMLHRACRSARNLCACRSTGIRWSQLPHRARCRLGLFFAASSLPRCSVRDFQLHGLS